jgi:hypothetical protein
MAQVLWRYYLWLGAAVIRLVAGAIEGHGITAIVDLYFLHRGRFALISFTTFVRDILIALCAVSIGAKLLGCGVSREPRPRALS